MSSLIFWSLFILFSLFIPYQFLGLVLPWSKVFMFISFIFLILFSKRRELYIPAISKVFLVFIILTIFLYFLKLFDNFYYYSIRDFFVILSPLEGPFFIIVFYLAYKKFYNISLFYIVLFAAFIVNVLAIIQFFNILGLKNFVSEVYGSGNQEQWNDYFKYNLRSFSVFNNQPNLLGIFNVFIIIILIIFKEFLFIKNFYYYISILGSLIGLLTSGSITSILSLFFVLIIYGIERSGKILAKVLSLFVFFMVMVFLFLPTSVEKIIERQKLEGSLIPSSLKARISNVWSISIDRLNENPVLGIGPAAATLEFGTDNEYLDKFLRYGYFGGTIFILLILLLIYFPIKKYFFTLDYGLKRQFFFSFLIALTFSLSLFTGSFLRADKIVILFWLFYILPFLNEKLTN